MEEEIWKDIPGFEGRYQASNQGRVRSLSRKVTGKNPYTNKPFIRTVKGRILKPARYAKSGHVSVVLGHGENGSPIHQLVMLAFLGPKPNGKEVLHRNGDPTDNRLTNLHYGSRSENIIDVYYQGKKWRKLSVDDVINIRQELLRGVSCKELAQRYGVAIGTISNIKVGRTFVWLK